MPPRTVTPKLTELAKVYTLEHCQELLDLDPAGIATLYEMAHEQNRKRVSKLLRGRMRKLKAGGSPPTRRQPTLPVSR